MAKKVAATGVAARKERIAAAQSNMAADQLAEIKDVTDVFAGKNVTAAITDLEDLVGDLTPGTTWYNHVNGVLGSLKSVPAIVANDAAGISSRSGANNPVIPVAK